jgi:NAD(P)-dependent dehydrogenase (short-subunit alcohol dehydrogenase family)
MQEVKCRRLVGKSIIIAGASSGIGRVTALRMAAEGAAVMLAAPAADAARLDAVKQAIEAGGGVAFTEHFDAAYDESSANLVRRAEEVFGGIDAVHANFADLGVIFHDSDAVLVSDEVLDRTLDINLKGMLRITRHAVPALLRRGGGAMIYTSSGAAVAGEPERPCYAMSKSGLNALVRHVASRWGTSNIRANAIMPGFIVTDENRGGLPPGFLDAVLKHGRSPRTGRPEDIAAMAALLASDDGEWINGQTIAVDGGAVLY